MVSVGLDAPGAGRGRREGSDLLGKHADISMRFVPIKNEEQQDL
jgi:hypothetical protein